MNIAFIAPEFGGGITDIYNLSYLILGADQTTKQQKIQKKPQMNADERRSITSAQNPQNRTRMTSPTRMGLAIRGDPCSLVSGKTRYEQY